MRISGVTYVPRKTHRLQNFLLIMLILVLLAAIAALVLSLYFEWDIRTLVSGFLKGLLTRAGGLLKN